MDLAYIAELLMRKSKKIKMLQIYEGIYYVHDMILRGFVNNDIEVTLFAISNENKIINKNGVKVYFVKCIQISKPFIIGLRYLSNVANFILQTFTLYIQVNRYTKKNIKDIDIFYGNKPVGNIIASILRKKYNKPSVSRYYGSFICSYLNKSILHKLYYKYQEYISFRLKKDLTIITKDGTSGEKVAEYFNIPQDQYRVYHNGKDPVSHTKIPHLNDKITVLSLSNMPRWKRIDRLINAIPGVIAEMDNVEFVIVGDGAEKSRLEKQVEKLGVSNYVKFLGHIPHEKVNEVMSNADLFCSMQDYCSFSKNVKEAMSNSLCVITLNVGSIDGIIENYRNGILLNKENLKEELAQTIIRLAKDEELRLKIGENARKFVEGNIWSWEERIEAEVNDIRNIVLKEDYNA